MKALIPVLALAGGLVGPAMAQDATRSLSAIIAGLETQGYRVTDVDVDRDSIEVDAITSDGRRVELRVDSGTGAILSETPDD